MNLLKNSPMKLEVTLGKNYSSHTAVLIKYVQKCTGPILELGGGIHSTPMLHWLCKAERKYLKTYESDETFYQFLKMFRSKGHSIKKIDINQWDSLSLDQHWGLIFIDHSPHPQRGKDCIKFANNADYIVVHDSEPQSQKKFGYDIAFNQFKYRKDYIDSYPNTTVLSNFKELW